MILFDSIAPSVSIIEGIPGTWLISNLISQPEAKKIIENTNFDEIIDTRPLREDNCYKPSIQRVSKRCKKDCPLLASEFYNRLQNIAPAQLDFDQEDSELGGFLKGSWRFHSVNERISFLKYEPEGHFSIHRDGIFIKHEDLRSLITILIYLNNDYVGGRTKAYSDDDRNEFAIEPVVGDAFMMIQKVLHEGGVVEEGTKYALRIDLLYERITPFVQEIYDKNLLAAEYLRIANDLERSFQGMEAIKYYQKAFKLNPKLEEML